MRHSAHCEVHGYSIFEKSWKTSAEPRLTVTTYKGNYKNKSECSHSGAVINNVIAGSLLVGEFWQGHLDEEREWKSESRGFASSQKQPERQEKDSNWTRRHLGRKQENKLQEMIKTTGKKQENK